MKQIHSREFISSFIKFFPLCFSQCLFCYIHQRDIHQELKVEVMCLPKDFPHGHSAVYSYLEFSVARGWASFLSSQRTARDRAFCSGLQGQNSQRPFILLYWFVVILKSFSWKIDHPSVLLVTGIVAQTLIRVIPAVQFLFVNDWCIHIQAIK